MTDEELSEIMDKVKDAVESQPERSNTSLGYWNKNMFELFAEKTPETCPDCESNHNFTLTRKKPSGPIQITDLYILKHSCGWKKDITPWEIA